MKRIVVAGATGFVGRALVDALAARGDQVTALVRQPEAAKLPSGVQVRRYDALAGDAASQVLDGQDAVVNLVGESIAGRWTARKKQAIYDSRVVTTRNLVAALRRCSDRPKALINASAVGYYGSRGDEPLDETAAPGSDFLARLTVDWEREARAATVLGVRVVCVRQGIVLGRGGALEAMLLPFKLGIGGPLANGRQWFPWIHIDDDVGMFLHAIDDETLEGPVNAVSPDIAKNARFAHALGHALCRPSFARVPRAALKLAFGELADSLVTSELVLPIRAQQIGFQFGQERLEEALLRILDPESDRRPATSRFESSVAVRAAPEKVFPIISDIANLGRLLPPDLDFRLLNGPREMRTGAAAEFEFTFRGRRLHWRAVIAEWKPPLRFIAEQVRGQCVLWRHEHAIQGGVGDCVVNDRIDFLLPGAPFSRILIPGVRRELERIFGYRGRRLAQRAGSEP